MNNLYMFGFTDRPFGGRFIAVIHKTREEALECALDQVANNKQERIKYGSEVKAWPQFRLDKPQDRAKVGAWVSGFHEE